MEILKIKVLYDITINDYLKLLGLGKHKINNLIDGSKIRNGKIVIKQNDLLKKGDILYINITEYEKIDYKPLEADLNILYEDDYLLIIDKPQNTIIYDLEDQEASLANYLRFYYQLNNINRTIRHVHRLDRDTTGCILFAKDFLTHAALSKMLENDEILRVYHAEVEGKVNKKGIIDKNIGKDRHNKNKMVITSSGVQAITHYRLLEYNKNTNTSTVEVILETGRTHQIRVHFAGISHPLVGDSIYNPNSKGDNLKLRSAQIRFIHPITNQLIDIKV